MTITWEVVAAFLVVGGAVTGGFWRIWGLIGEAKQEALLRAEAGTLLAGMARDDLAAYKLKVAETYVTKAGLSEQTAQIMKALDGVSFKLDHLNGRIDGLMKPATTPRSRSQ